MTGFRLWAAIGFFATILFAAQACSPAQPSKESAMASATVVQSAIPDTAAKSQVAADDLNPSDASRLAASDFAKGECKLYAVAGYTWSIPGTTLYPITAKPIYQIVYISGTSDAITPETDRRNKVAIAFAEPYNRAALNNCGDKK